jgi:hypothetical protein
MAVSASFYAPRLQYFILFFLVLFLHCLYILFAPDRASYVRLLCVTIILQKQGAQGILAELLFGTRRR